MWEGLRGTGTVALYPLLTRFHSRQSIQIKSLQNGCERHSITGEHLA